MQIAEWLQLEKTKDFSILNHNDESTHAKIIKAFI